MLEREKRHALMVVLGYSRRMWLRFHERQTMGVVIRGGFRIRACRPHRAQTA